MEIYFVLLKATDKNFSSKPFLTERAFNYHEFLFILDHTISIMNFEFYSFKCTLFWIARKGNKCIKIKTNDVKVVDIKTNVVKLLTWQGYAIYWNQLAYCFNYVNFVLL